MKEANILLHHLFYHQILMLQKYQFIIMQLYLYEYNKHM